MKCTYCGSLDGKVIESRPLDGSSVIRRRRQCFSCGKRFTTYERLEIVPLMVLKSNDLREPFSRDKLRQGIMHACEKRPITTDAIEKMVSEIEYELQDYVMEVKSSTIGDKVLQRLKVIDEVAYIRFASVYRNFNDLDSFRQELKKLKKKRSY